MEAIYGVWIIGSKSWLVDGNGIVFHTPYPAVAEAQREIADKSLYPTEVRQMVPPVQEAKRRGRRPKEA